VAGLLSLGGLRDEMTPPRLHLERDAAEEPRGRNEQGRPKWLHPWHGCFPLPVRECQKSTLRSHGEIPMVRRVSSNRDRARNLHRTLRVAHPTHARATRDVRLASALIVAVWERKSRGVLLEAVVGLMSGRPPSFELRDERVICGRLTSHVCGENQSPEMRSGERERG
jgi:hypothetical protein